MLVPPFARNGKVDLEADDTARDTRLVVVPLVIGYKPPNDLFSQGHFRKRVQESLVRLTPECLRAGGGRVRTRDKDVNPRAFPRHPDLDLSGRSLESQQVRQDCA